MKSFLKFNLYLPTENKKANVGIVDLEDLRNNFNIDDILELFSNKKLQYWLKSRSEEGDEYSIILNEINELNSGSKKSKDELMFQIYKIFFPGESDENIKDIISKIVDNHTVKELKLKLFKNANAEFDKNLNKILNLYLSSVEKLVKKGNSDFEESMNHLQLINDNWSELFKLHCPNLIHKLIKEKSQIALFGLFIFNNLKRIVFNEMDSATKDIWVKNYKSLTNFCESFVKRYIKNNKYKKFINVKTINEIFDSGKDVEIIEPSGEFLIMNIPVNCKVRDNKDKLITVGEFCKGEFKISRKSNIAIFKNNDSITRQLHYIKIRNEQQ